MVRWDDFDAAEKAQVHGAFSLVVGLQERLEARPEEGEDRVTMQEVYALAVDPAAVMTNRLRAAMLRRPELRRLWERFLRDNALAEMPPLDRAAASGDERVRERTGSGWRIRVLDSDAVADLAHVIVDLTESWHRSLPRAISIAGDGRFHKVPLPEPSERRFRLMGRSDEDWILDFQDPDSSVWLT